MGGLAIKGVSFGPLEKIAIRGYPALGLAAQGQLVWTPPAKGWRYLTSTIGAGMGATSPAIDTTGADLLVAAVTAYSNLAVPTGMNDSFGNTWNVLRSVNTGFFHADIVWCKPTEVGPGHTFQALPATGTDWFPGFVVAAFSGSDAAPLDQFVGGGPASASITPTAANTVILTAVCLNAAGTPSVNGPFTTIGVSPWQGGFAMGCGLAGFLQEGAAPVTATWTGAGPSSTSAVSFFESPIRVLPSRRKRPRRG